MGLSTFETTLAETLELFFKDSMTESSVLIGGVVMECTRMLGVNMLEAMVEVVEVVVVLVMVALVDRGSVALDATSLAAACFCLTSYKIILIQVTTE